MKRDTPVPMEKLLWFQKRLGLEQKELDILNSYHGLFSNKKEEFSENFSRYFSMIPATRIFLEHEARRGHLKRVWGQWFESLFKDSDNQRLLTYLWRSGLLHVENKVDQRFINLGFSVVRQFCQKVVEAEVPPSDKETLLVALDKMIDLCLLVETQAFISAASQCDMEVVKGISHQVRNPLTIIGGHIARLKRNVEPGNPVHKVYDTILEENKRLEKMVIDVEIYSEMFEKEPVYSQILLEELVSKAFERLKATPRMQDSRMEIDLDFKVTEVAGDPEDLEMMFFYLLENSLEAIDPGNPTVRISSRLKGEDSAFAEIEILNSGNPLNQKDIENLFVPFYSSKPLGTGFGLPIAQLAARKSLGDLYLEPVSGGGARCLIELPVFREPSEARP